MPASAATASMVSRAAPSRLTTVSAAVRTASLSMILRRPIGHPISNQTVGYISLGLAAVKQRYAGALRKLANDQRASVFCKGNSSGTATPPFRFLRRSAIRRDLRVWTADPKKASCNRLAEVAGLQRQRRQHNHTTNTLSKVERQLKRPAGQDSRLEKGQVLSAGRGGRHALRGPPFGPHHR